jgi:undecaprenyl diphosphate synthase
MSEASDPQLSRVPRHVAIIMDGNGRWAARRRLPRIAGHEAGTENIRRITTRAAEIGIEYLTLWAFSTENWRRPRDEVEGILRILAGAIESETDELNRQGARLHHIGSLDGLPPSLAQSVRDAIDLTRTNERIQLTLAFNYGGRAEVVQAVQRIVAAHVPREQINEELIGSYLYTHDMPDPDLIVRTSGELRTSNFLIWQGAFAEYHFTDVLWPDFGPADFDLAVADYASRDRRFGGLTGAEPHQPAHS